MTPAAAEEAVEPLEACLDRFWELGDGLETFQAPIMRPAVEAGLLKRLGKPPLNASRARSSKRWRQPMPRRRITPCVWLLGMRMLEWVVPDRLVFKDRTDLYAK